MWNVLDFSLVSPSWPSSQIRTKQVRLAAHWRHLAKVVVHRRDSLHQSLLGRVRHALVPVPLVVGPKNLDDELWI